MPAIQHISVTERSLKVAFQQKTEMWGFLPMWVGVTKKKLHHVVNFVINIQSIHSVNLQHGTTLNCISIVADRLFFVYIYMTREGIEKLLNIKDRSYYIFN